MKILLQQDYLS